MNKKILPVVLGSAFLGMGLSMPSCPGQQAMQQQLDQLQTTNATMSKKLQAMDSELKTANTDIQDLKKVVVAFSTAIQADQAATQKLDATVKSLQEQVVKLSTPPAKGKKPLRRK